MISGDVHGPVSNFGNNNSGVIANIVNIVQSNYSEKLVLCPAVAMTPSGIQDENGRDLHLLSIGMLKIRCTMWCVQNIFQKVGVSVG